MGNDSQERPLLGGTGNHPPLTQPQKNFIDECNANAQALATGVFACFLFGGFGLSFAGTYAAENGLNSEMPWSDTASCNTKNLLIGMGGVVGFGLLLLVAAWAVRRYRNYKLGQEGVSEIAIHNYITRGENPRSA